MRAGIILEALCERYRVSLLVVPLSVSDEQVPDIFKCRCESVIVVPSVPDLDSALRQAGQVYQGREFDIVHVFRLAALPFARPYLRQAGDFPQQHLDLDDIESKTRKRIAALYHMTGNAEMAAREDAGSKRAQMLEIAAFRMFDRVYVCSDADRTELLDR